MSFILNIFKCGEIRQVKLFDADPATALRLVDNQLRSYVFLWATVFMAFGALFMDLLWLDKNWFGRSGALIVGAGIAVAYYRDVAMDPFHMGTIQYSDCMNEIRVWHTSKSAFLTIIGTIIWAFGDFFWPVFWALRDSFCSILIEIVGVFQ